MPRTTATATAEQLNNRHQVACTLIACLFLIGCGARIDESSSSQVQPITYTQSISDSGNFTVVYTRRIAPFPILDQNGQEFEHPFLGGFNMPRPQLLDIDGDADVDLFVQDVSGSVAFFENRPGQTPQFLWRTDRYQDLDIGEWYRFVDLDLDGDHDLLAEQPFSYVRYYRNEGTSQEPRFVEIADSLKDLDGTPLFSDRQNIPNATDIDCDQQVDLLIGRLVGRVSRYERVNSNDLGVPRFQHLTDFFEDIEIIAQIGSLHGANTMALGDIDNDGDKDLFWGDYFEPGILFIENTGTCQSASLGGEPVSFPPSNPIKTSGYNAPTIGDVDGDGDQDLLVGALGGAFNPNTTTVDNLHYIEQSSTGLFTARTSRFVSMIDVGSESIPVVVDLDGDDDLDILLGNKIEQNDPQNGKLYRLINEGSPRSPRFRMSGELDIGNGYHFLPAFADLDGDTDLDAILGTWGDELRFYENQADDGSIQLALADSVITTLTRGRNATPTLGDLDADGDADMIVGESSGTLNFYENTGTTSQPEFTLISDEYLDLDVGRRSVPVLHDFDSDGDLDLIVGSESEGIRLLRNDGTRVSPVFTDAGPIPLEDFGFAAPAFGDVDGDGDDDIFLGGSGGGLWFYENQGRK